MGPTNNNFPDSGSQSPVHGAMALGIVRLHVIKKNAGFWGYQTFFQNGMLAQNCSVRSISCIYFYGREEQIHIVVVKEEGLVSDGKRKSS